MNNSSQLWLIARRDFVTRGRSRAFQISTALLAAAVVAVVLANWLLGDDEAEAAEATIGLTEGAADVADQLDRDSDELITTIVVPATVDDVIDGDVDALFDGSSITWRERPRGLVDRHIRQTVSESAILRRAADAGLTPDELAALFATDEIEEIRIDGSQEESGLRFAAALAAAAVTTFLIQVWGSFLAMGVVEEKASRIVEILLSHVRPTALLGGKILGIGALALAQLLIVVGGLVVGLLLTDSVDVPSEVWATMPLSIITFFVGFGFYATLFAAAGATVSRQEDATTAQVPVLVPLMAGWFIAVAGIGSPDNLAMTLASFVPFTSPIVMPARYALGAMPPWQVGLSLVLLVVTAVFMVRVAAAVYRSSLLRTGGRISFGDAWRSRADPEVGADHHLEAKAEAQER